MDDIKIEEYYKFLNKGQLDVIRKYSKLVSANRFNMRMAELKGSQFLEDDWVYLGYIDLGERVGHCTLGHSLRYEHYAHNIVTYDSIVFGVKCVGDFFDLSLEQIKLIEKGVRETNSEIIRIFREMGDEEKLRKDRELVEKAERIDTENKYTNIIEKAKEFVQVELPIARSLHEQLKNLEFIKKREEHRKNLEKRKQRLVELINNKDINDKIKGIEIRSDLSKNFKANLIKVINGSEKINFEVYCNKYISILDNIEKYLEGLKFIEDVKLLEGEIFEVEEYEDKVVFKAIEEERKNETTHSYKVESLLAEEIFKELNNTCSTMYKRCDIDNITIELVKEVEGNIKGKRLVIDAEDKWAEKEEKVRQEIEKKEKERVEREKEREKKREEIDLNESKIIGIIQKKAHPYNMTLGYVIEGKDGEKFYMNKYDIVNKVEQGQKIVNAKIKSNKKSKFIVGDGVALSKTCKTHFTESRYFDDREFERVREIF